MATQLGIYNGALRILKERKLLSLTENREPRRLLDDVWADGRTEGAVQYCLQVGPWTFARRTVQIDYSPSITPAFGYRYAFDQPADMVKPVMICADERMKSPVLEYSDERHYWYSDLQTMYVTYVSDGLTYGGDMSLWNEKFIKLVEAHLAREIAGNVTNDSNIIAYAEKAYDEARKEAMSDDAMRQPTRFMPPGQWTTARHGNSLNRSLWNQRG